jgi:hypothetical protein
MVLAYAVIFTILLAWLLRRDLRAIGRQPYRGGGKLVATVAGLFVLQAAAVLYVPGQTLLQMALLILSQTALVLLVLLNRHLAGAKLLVLGITLNTLVMVANGGWMPVTPETYRFVHPERSLEVQARPPSSKGIILPREQTRLWLLSDVIRVTLPWRRNAVSLGDVLLVAGAAHFILGSTSRRDQPAPGWST